MSTRPAQRTANGSFLTNPSALILLALVAAGWGCGTGDDPAVSTRTDLERQYGRRNAGVTDSPTASLSADTAAHDAADRPAAPLETGRDDTGAPGEDIEPPAADPRPRGSPAVDRPVPAEAAVTEAPVVDPAQEVDPTWLLAAADQAYANLSSLRARFQQVVEISLLGRRRMGAGIWYQKGRDLFRLDFQDPPDDEIVSDGTYLWLYTPSDTPGQVIRSTLQAGSTEADVLARLLSEARTKFDATYEGRTDVGGQSTDVVRLDPRPGASYREVRLWIGVRDRLVRRFTIIEENETRRTITLTELEPGAAIPDEVFLFTPPEGVEVFEG